MTIFKTAVIVGSLRKDSHNLKLAKALLKLGEGKLTGQVLRIDDLPLYNQDLESSFPQAATRFKNDIESADAVLFVTPEYNRSIPGPLKNAIDWASRPYGKNSFAGKAAAITGASPGAIGTALAQHSLRLVLGYLDVALMGQPEIYLQFKEGMIAENGDIADEGTRKFLEGFIKRFVTWVERVSPK